MRELQHIARFIAAHPLTRKNQLAAWYRVVKWQATSRLKHEVIVPWLGGQRLAVRRGMRGITGNIYAGVHEFPDMMLTLHALRPGDLFLDIGSNVGSYTILASGVSGATTWAFEPDPVTLAHLRRNIVLNSLEDRVEVFDCALGDSDGEAFFTVGLDTNNKVLTDPDGETTRRVPQRRLDSLTTGVAPFMIKMDTEGHEDHVFAGAVGTLARASLRIIVAETVSETAEAALAEHGFLRSFYDPLARRLSGTPLGYASANSLWVRDRSFVQERLKSAGGLVVLGRLI